MIQSIRKHRGAQAALEYLLILTAIIVVVLVGFNTFLPRTGKQSERVFNEAARGIMGPAPRGVGYDKVRTGAENYP